ncbi:hypothetical protein BDV96DRAFT_652991 [Lophiotrema nucula]|uniref:FAD-dependent oxidoreductase 2 FAD binding domain-containing protein n=1 Tax=Lophiotrema nucula TaxID=690887 RepID=A0A6A5YQF5_9PLEO|nr:hypothetical protein BDV96DRAFT_652991 [Lophiotrema nucula]
MAPYGLSRITRIPGFQIGRDRPRTSVADKASGGLELFVGSPSELPEEEVADVFVVGGGNAGFSAAIAAVQAGAGHVILVDKCPRDWAGGNTYFTAGAFRAVHNGLNDILPVATNVDTETARIIDLTYTALDFRRDMDRMTAGRTEPGGMALKTDEGGKGLIKDYQAAARQHGVDVYYSTPAKRIITDKRTGAIAGLVVESNDINSFIATNAIILAAGGFKANPQARARHLSPS